MRTARLTGIITAALSVFLLSHPAFAQKIRSYGGDAEKTYGTSYQGSQAQQTTQTAQGQQPSNALLPTGNQQQAQGQQQGEQQQGADGETELQPSYVTVFRPGGAQAPLPVDLTPEKMYRGVIPGTRDEVTHLTDARQEGADRSNRNRVTWIGFQARDESTRIFVQTAREADYTLGEGEEGSVTLTFNDTRLSARNFGRFVDTSFFDRNVTRIEVDQVDKTTVVATISLRQYERPDVDRNGNYLYLDFSHTPQSEVTSTDDQQ